LQQLDRVDDDRAVARRACDAFPNVLPHGGMDDAFELCQSGLSAEDDSAEQLSIHAAVGLKNLRPEGIRDCLRDLGAGALQLVHHGIGIDSLAGAQLEQDIAYGCFAAADGSGDAEDARRPPRTPVSHSPCASRNSATSSPYRSVSSAN